LVSSPRACALTKEEAMNRTALIVGITGGFGSETARALLAHGWTVRALHRDPARARRAFERAEAVEWVEGDAMKANDVALAAAGASVVVHAANPPGYRNWRGLAMPMLEASIAAARAAGARIVLPGNVYNFGPDAPAIIDEAVPQRPLTRKGKIRVEMEERLRAASESGVRVLVVRAGDFFGPHAASSWFSQGLVKPGKPVRSVVYPGTHDASHAWAYLPDLALTIARLLEREGELGRFEVFHFAGHGFARGVEIAEATQAAAGISAARIRRFPWFVIYLLSPFVAMFREMLEMRYLWSASLCSTIASWSRSSAASRTRRSIARCERRSKVWAACLRRVPR
jgi:nucleoside-diphosphate-sugar epimerase